MSVISSPFRSTTIDSVSSAESITMLCSSEKDSIALPSTLTMRSPGLMPARSAALSGIDRLRDRQDVRPADQREDRREDDDGEDEVRGRAGGDDGDALPERRKVEEPCALGERRRGQRLRIGHAGGILVALEAHIAAKRDRGELPARAAAVGEAGKLAAEADGEGRDADAAPAGDEEMPHLVHEHDGGQHDQRRDDVAGEDPAELEQAFPSSVSRVASGRRRTALQIGPGDPARRRIERQRLVDRGRLEPAIPRIRLPSRRFPRSPELR